MKKTVFFFALGALLLSSWAGKDQKKIEEDSAKIADLTAEYEEATNFNDSLMLLMGDIYTGLDSINTQEGLLYNMGAGDAADRRVPRNLKIAWRDKARHPRKSFFCTSNKTKRGVKLLLS